MVGDHLDAAEPAIDDGVFHLLDGALQGRLDPAKGQDTIQRLARDASQPIAGLAIVQDRAV